MFAPNFSIAIAYDEPTVKRCGAEHFIKLIGVVLPTTISEERVSDTTISEERAGFNVF